LVGLISVWILTVLLSISWIDPAASLICYVGNISGVRQIDFSNNYCTMFVVVQYGEECKGQNIEYGSLKSTNKLLDETCALFEELDGNEVAACFCISDYCNNPTKMAQYIEQTRSSYEPVSDVGYWKPFTTKDRDKDMQYFNCLLENSETFDVLDVDAGSTPPTDMATSIIISAVIIFLLSAIAMVFCGAIAGSNRSKY
ncbi:hypothetical protein ANCCAN_04083, partial [Ancylostoma caninum]